MNWSFWLLIAAIILLVPTGYAAKVGAPYVPTRRRALKKALREANIGKGETLIDLGSGDGTVALEAAQRGATAIGYELSPIMWFIGWLRALPHKSATIKLRDFYKQTLPKETTHIFAFLVPQTMPSLKKYLVKQTLPDGKYLLVNAFPFKDGTRPTQIIRTEKNLPIYIYDLTKLTK